MKKEAYEISAQEALKIYKTNINGLTLEEAENRLFENGLNKLYKSKKKNIITKFFEQMKNVMVIILIIASIVSFTMAKIEGESIIESVIILLVVFLNALLGLVQEMKAEKSIEALKDMSMPYIKVRRNGEIESVKVEELVIGDIVLLEAGDFVPADMRIILNFNLKVEEAHLTGESFAIEKNIDEIKEEVPLGDRKNMLYSGSSVVYGRAEALVTATGMNTELGKIATMLQEEKEELTPLQRKLNEISKMLSIVVVVVGLVMVVTGLLRNYPLLEIFMLSVSLAVAAIPEGLPAAITVILSIGVQKMAKQNAVIRKLSSVETLGATEIICSDKTGTLTQNKMTVEKIYINNEEYLKEDERLKDLNVFDRLYKAMMLCNDTKENKKENEKSRLLGDPTETSLVTVVERFSQSKNKYESMFERVGEIPFDSDRKMMTTINKEQGNFYVYSKGAIESVLESCKYIQINGEIKELDKKQKEMILSKNTEMSDSALRILGFAYKKLQEMPKEVNIKVTESELIYIGLVAMRDPPREEVFESVKQCIEASMVPIMITGDNINTAKAIAKEIGILQEDQIAITGSELDNMSDDEFKSKIYKIRVYARVSPQNKVRIVKMWKSLGKIVSMTGDGVNDAPALKIADIRSWNGNNGY